MWCSLGSLQGVANLLEPWQWEALLRLIVCVVVGGAIGLEREFHGRAAGFRTHILVCLGCCLVMLASLHFPRMYAHFGADSSVRLDPARLAYGVITGVGFLGAGVIMKSGVTVHGLTTAASLWCVAALGLSVGVGMFTVAGVGAMLMLLSLVGMRHMDVLLGGHHYRTLRITHGDESQIESVRRQLETHGAAVLKVSLDHRCAEGKVITTYDLRFRGEKDVADLYEILYTPGRFERIEIE